MAVRVAAISIGAVGFGTGSLPLVNTFLWISAIILWLLVAFGIASWLQGRRRRTSVRQ